MSETVIKAFLSQGRILSENSDAARSLYNQSRFGSLLPNGLVQFSLAEALYLLEKNRILLFDGKNRLIDADKFLKRAKKSDKNFWVRFCVFRDVRDRGYIVKTALKFGADFRVYDRGVKPGEDHAKWVLFPVHESEVLTWYDFAAKTRVAHSTKKKLLIAVVDDEGDVSYWETRWLRP
ncbi:tRNA-intron lyase [Candidatus Woesearchaeota archaeon]|nr:tRNA-intron lyase [Candidatus Woesearchaeota archaeon]